MADMSRSRFAKCARITCSTSNSSTQSKHKNRLNRSRCIAHESGQGHFKDWWICGQRESQLQAAYACLLCYEGVKSNTRVLSNMIPATQENQLTHWPMLIKDEDSPTSASTKPRTVIPNMYIKSKENIWAIY